MKILAYWVGWDKIKNILYVDVDEPGRKRILPTINLTSGYTDPDDPRNEIAPCAIADVPLENGLFASLVIGDFEEAVYMKLTARPGEEERETIWVENGVPFLAPGCKGHWCEGCFHNGISSSTATATPSCGDELFAVVEEWSRLPWDTKQLKETV